MEYAGYGILIVMVSISIVIADNKVFYHYGSSGESEAELKDEDEMVG